MRQAQVNLARNLGREAFGVIFPDMPFPEEALRPGEARQNPPPTPTTPNLAPPAPPSHEQTPNVALPPSSTTRTTTVHQSDTPDQDVTADSTVPSSAGRASRPRTLLAPPTPIRSSIASASTADSPNPLARFSLPNLELPPSGEAGLYHVPPSFGNVDLSPSTSTSRSPSQLGYADIAYGAFPQFGGRETNVPRPHGYTSVGTIGRPQTLDERIKQIRERMTQGSPISTQADVGEVTTTEPAVEHVVADENRDKGKGKAKATETDETEVDTLDETRDSTSTSAGAPSPREAALLAAERRQTAQNGRSPSPSRWIRRTDTLAPWSEAAQSTPLPPSREPSPTPPTSRTPPMAHSRPQSAPGSPRLRPASSTSIPRLIPLFDPSNPSGAPLYPSLASHPTLSAAPLPSTSSSAAQLEQEVDQLVRRTLEEKLKVLTGFQDRLEGLAADMRTALTSIPGEPRSRHPHGSTPAEAGSERNLSEVVELEKVAADDVES